MTLWQLRVLRVQEGLSAEVTNKIFTLPNLISLIRLVLVPIFAIVLIVYENNILAFILFVIAASTDFLDGAIARGMGQVSRLGQQLDPLVDRVLILTAVILVFVLGRVPFWVLLVIIARDLSMLVLLAQMRIAGLPKLEVVLVGKAGTALNMVGFSLLILLWPIVPGLNIVEATWLPGWGVAEAPLGIWFIYVGMILAWVAGFYYMFRAYHQAKDSGGKGGGNSGGGTRNYERNQERLGQERSTQQVRRTQGGRYSSAQQQEGLYDALQQRYAEEALNTSGSSRRNTSSRGQARGRHTAANSSAASRSSSTSKIWSGGAKGSPGAGALSRILNTPGKMIAAIAALLFIVLAAGFYGCDAISNNGVIHSGVRVGSIDVGGMEEAEAAQLIHSGLNAIASSDEVVLYANEEALEQGVTSKTVQLGHGVNAYEEVETDESATSWTVTLGTIDAEVDGASLAKDAFGVGRGGDFFLGRLAASTFGVTIEPRVEFSKDRLRGVEEMLTESIGTPMKNASISFNGTTFEASNGQDGYVVDEVEFEKRLQNAFLSEDRSLIVPMVDRAMYVSLEDAQLVAASMQEAIADPVTVSYEEASWQLKTEDLGRVISTSVAETEDNGWQLVPSVDVEALKLVLPEIIGNLDDQVAPVDAQFKVVEEELTLVPGQNGAGVDYPRLAEDLNSLLFGEQYIENSEENSDDASSQDEGDSDASEDTQESSSVNSETRTVQLLIGELEPNFTTSDAEAYDFSNKITEYTVEYPWVVQGTITNVHVASDIINSTIVDPQSTWSLIETVGECSEENGFVAAPVILYDEYVDDIGGGLCNTATAVFNAAYDAGYPIKERINHSLRNSNYPLGRDAAVAFPYADLKFENDTDNYLLITMHYTDWSVTCTLWGVSPGYVVESVTGEFVEGEEYPTREVVDETFAPGQTYIEQEGKDASSVDVTRTVYYADGTLKEQWTFYSSYDSTPKIVKVGPKTQSQ